MGGKILKGTVSTIDGNTATIIPLSASKYTSTGITIPWHLRNDTYNTYIQKGTKVIYVEFEDSTGMIIERFDGNRGGA